MRARPGAVTHVVGAAVAVVGARRPAGGGVVRRARGVRAVARLGDVAHASGRTARGPGRDDGVGGTIVADAVAAVSEVADAGDGPAHVDALAIRWTRVAGAGARLGDVAYAGRGTTDGPGR